MMVRSSSSFVVGLLFFLILPTNIIGLWWAVGSPLNLDPNSICRRSRKLRGSGNKQHDICRREPEIVDEVVKGTRLAMKECQYQLRYHRWNCTMLGNSFVKILKQDTPETALANAITASGVAFTVTQACSLGDLLQCGCAESTKTTTSESPGPDGSWEWGGCGDNIEFGYTKSKEFMDTQIRRRSDVKTLITLHNNEAGRMTIKRFMRRECKCHGLSGSCTLRTCWEKMPSFREAGTRLMDRYKGSAKVTGGNDGETLIPEDSTIKPPTELDLVYSMDSPDFCEPNPKTGSLGTEGRRCNSTSMDVGGCDILCCSRGYVEETVVYQVNCRCRFHWCCEVNCDNCTVQATINRCNGYGAL
ncbi:protein Wnt-6-like isoform X2 [Patiria miniata]|uniref:Protein Wnt n=1 Tax=Patiria miniata TaxID=46514 RepID=A0A913Z848_PATMI|nr:protein Wnt-6-like isoform X2 [Patiria miniata]